MSQNGNAQNDTQPNTKLQNGDQPKAEQPDERPVVPTVVRDLIHESHEIQGWISKLGENADENFPQVVERIRTDYHGRLQGVAGQLKEHRPSLRTDLDKRRKKVDSLRSDREGHLEDLEDVRVRHAVGELNEKQWDTKHRGIESDLEKVDSILAVEDEAVAELATVVDSVDRIVGTGNTSKTVTRVIKPRFEGKKKAKDDSDSWSQVVSKIETEDECGGPADDELAFLETVSSEEIQHTDPVLAALLNKNGKTK